MDGYPDRPFYFFRGIIMPTLCAEKLANLLIIQREEHQNELGVVQAFVVGKHPDSLLTDLEKPGKIKNLSAFFADTIANEMSKGAKEVTKQSKTHDSQTRWFAGRAERTINCHYKLEGDGSVVSLEVFRVRNAPPFIQLFVKESNFFSLKVALPHVLQKMREEDARLSVKKNTTPSHYVQNKVETCTL